MNDDDMLVARSETNDLGADGNWADDIYICRRARFNTHKPGPRFREGVYYTLRSLETNLER